MKKIILLAILFKTVSASALGNVDAPAAVKAKFASLYPDVIKVKWIKEEANYEAGFEMNKTEMSCIFDREGNLLETESEIDISSLPATAIEYIHKNYPGQKIREAAQIVDSKKVTTFEAEVKEGDLIFDSNGNFLKKVVSAKEKEDEQDEK